jgi:CheY-like chemotaxis protein
MDLISIKVEEQTNDMIQNKFSNADQDSYICISVTDTGEGMDKTTLLRIFDPFFTTKEFGKGTGLGLAVVHGVMQSHRGFVDVDSMPGYGTTFRLYFPIPIADKRLMGIPKKIEYYHVGGTETILFVEDEEALLESVGNFLESKGYKVYTAKDGNDAVRLYAEHAKEIDLVLTDIGLPGITGKDVFKKIKDINPDVKVILASGFFELDLKAELMKAGANGIIQKPYVPDDILRIIRTSLDETG